MTNNTNPLIPVSIATAEAVASAIMKKFQESLSQLISNFK